MKFSFLTSVYQRYPLEKTFRDGVKFGYQGIELWGGRPHAYPFDMDDQKIETVRRLAKDTGMEISAYTPEVCIYPYNLCSRDKKERKETVEYFNLSLDIAKEIGAPIIQITPGDPGYGIDYDCVWGNLVEGCRMIAEHAEKVGVKIVMEALTPYESLILITTNDLLRLIREVSSDAFLGMLDCVNPVMIHEPVSDYFAKLKDKLGHIHLTDADGKSHRHLLIGDGVLPFESMFRTFSQYRYDGYCSVELGSEPYCRDPETFVELSIERIRRFLRKTDPVC